MYQVFVKGYNFDALFTQKPTRFIASQMLFLTDGNYQKVNISQIQMAEDLAINRYNSKLFVKTFFI